MPAGRKTKLTPKLQKEICFIIANGNYDKDACDAVGLGQSTFYYWLTKGEQAKTGIYREFLEAVKKARAVGKINHVNNIKKHSEHSWQASAWFLERKYPDDWGKRDRVELTHKHDWHSEIKQLYENGQITRADIINELGDSLAQEFFKEVDVETD